MNLPKGTTEKDTGIILTAGTLGFLVDTFFFPQGIPPGTTAALFASGALGINKLLSPTTENKESSPSRKEYESLYLKTKEMLEKCKHRHKIFDAIDSKLWKEFNMVPSQSLILNYYKNLLDISQILKLLCKVNKSRKHRIHAIDNRNNEWLESIKLYFDGILSKDELIELIEKDIVKYGEHEW